MLSIRSSARTLLSSYERYLFLRRSASSTTLKRSICTILPLSSKVHNKSVPNSITLKVRTKNSLIPPQKDNPRVLNSKIYKQSPISQSLDKMSPKTRIFLATFSVATVVTAVGWIIYSGRPFDTERENQFKDLDSFTAWYKRLMARTEDFLEFFTEPPSDKLLPDKDTLPNFPQHVLVINLDQTLIYSTWDREHGWRTAKRPGVDYFLAYMSSMFEEVVFTSQPLYVAEPIVMKLDPLGIIIPHKLFRESTRYIEGKHVKDLSKLNRDLSKVIIMDSNPDSYFLQPENAIAVPPWKGDPSDTYLIDIIPFMEHFILFDIQDVRQSLKAYKGKDIPRAFHEWEVKWKEKSHLQWEQLKQPKKGLASWASFIGGGHVQEHIPHYQQYELNREYLRKDFKENYKKLKEQAPELQRLLKQEQEYIEKQLKESKTTIWDLMIKGPPPIITPGMQLESQQSKPQSIESS